MNNESNFYYSNLLYIILSMPTNKNARPIYHVIGTRLAINERKFLQGKNIYSNK